MVGAATEAAVELPDADFGEQPMALFVGNEGQGLSEETRAELDCLVKIPMSEAIDSLSVNAATAVILYAMRASRWTTDAEERPPV
jgi:tRNA G18 (ribose-2'-O)-methylase SpoU